MKLWVRCTYQPNVAFLVIYPYSTVNSKALTVMTLAKRSSQHVGSKDSVKESESDAEEEGYLSENDLEITGEHQPASSAGRRLLVSAPEGGECERHEA